MNRVLLAALASGALFGAGLAVSSMTDRRVVLGFLDIFGAWNPTLAFVMGGAVAVTFVAFRWILKRNMPACGGRFRVPERDDIDVRLLSGATIFGVGWGLAGFCPGPALVGLAAGLVDAWIFLPAMIAGSWLAGRMAAR
jgi:uncharacterized membrane protein YedE/YeeE